MEQPKLETEFKRQLNQREINPTAAAWDRLDAMLTVAEEKKPPRNYQWLYVAAGIIGFVFIGFVFLSQTQEVSDVRKSEVVLQQNDTINPKQSTTPNKVNITTPALPKPVLATQVAQFKSPSTDRHAVKSLPNLDLKRQQKQIAENETNPQQPLAVPNNQKSGLLNLLKSDQIVAEEPPIPMVTQPKIQNLKSNITVNASSLLSQVDGELELSFREKIIKTVNKNYKSVKVALANRNNQ